MFYAEFNPYGVGAITERDGKSQSTGILYRFSNRRARDEYVDADVWDGKYFRVAITRAEAASYHSGAFHPDAEWVQFDDCPEQFVGRR